LLLTILSLEYFLRNVRIFKIVNFCWFLIDALLGTLVRGERMSSLWREFRVSWKCLHVGIFFLL